jgi:hypothetical protein
MGMPPAERSARYRAKDVAAYRARKNAYAKTPEQKEKRAAYAQKWRERKGAVPQKDAARRFDVKVLKDTSGCWLWQGTTNKDGYGVYRNAGAHRWAYEHFIGPIPEGLEIDHLCRVRNCVNPEHMEPVTHVENVRRGDYSKNGAALVALHTQKTHCPQGHAYTPDNLVPSDWARGVRRCRVCAAAKSRAYLARKREGQKNHAH